MKSFKIVSALVLALLLLTGGVGNNTAHAADWQELKVINLTGATIKGLYVSQSGYDKWGSNLLSSDLKHRTSTTIRYNANYSYYDMKVVFLNDDTVFWKDDNNRPDLSSRPSRMTIYYNPSTKRYSWYLG